MPPPDAAGDDDRLVAIRYDEPVQRQHPVHFERDRELRMPARCRRVRHSCTSPTSLAFLTDGEHTFQVRARDAAGNVDPTPATRTWTVDTTPPFATFTQTPTIPGGGGITHNGRGDIRVHREQAGASLEASLDGAAFAAASSPMTLTGLADGLHRFEVHAATRQEHRQGLYPRGPWTRPRRIRRSPAVESGVVTSAQHSIVHLRRCCGGLRP